jgi:hypothetical protein
MHSTHRFLGLIVAGGVACVIAACSSDDGKPSGSSSGTTPAADAGEEAAATTEGGATEAGAKKPNAAACALPEECESGFCFVGGNQSFCTIKCTAETATTLCVPPFTGSCNKQGYCKRD